MELEGEGKETFAFLLRQSFLFASHENHKTCVFAPITQKHFSRMAKKFFAILFILGRINKHECHENGIFFVSAKILLKLLCFPFSESCGKLLVNP